MPDHGTSRMLRHDGEEYVPYGFPLEFARGGGWPWVQTFKMCAEAQYSAAGNRGNDSRS